MNTHRVTLIDIDSGAHYYLPKIIFICPQKFFWCKQLLMNSCIYQHSDFTSKHTFAEIGLSLPQLKTKQLATPTLEPKDLLQPNLHEYVFEYLQKVSHLNAHGKS